MKAIITGANGTVGRALTERLRAGGHKVVGWNRELLPPDDYWAAEEFLRAEQPEVLYHLAIASRPTGRDNEPWAINFEWPSELAWAARQTRVKFVFTSTVMVFTNDARGPFTLESEPDAGAGYGHEKRLAEQRVLEQNPDATVARLGWQIGRAPGSNNMIDYLTKQNKSLGKIEASRRWMPACSFLEDTAAALESLATAGPGIRMIDSNRKWSFFDIVSALREQHDTDWNIVPNDQFVYDQRMQDPALGVPPLSKRLEALA